MHHNYHKLSRLFFYLDYFNPQINYLGLAQIILKLSPICDAFADDYWGLKLLSPIILKLSPICEGFSSIRRHLLQFATLCRPELHEKRNVLKVNLDVIQVV